MQELRRNVQERIKSIERKVLDKGQKAEQIKQAMDEYNLQKKELREIKKQEQEFNMKKNRKVQDAYKRILIEKLREKDERVRALQEKKQMIQDYKQKNMASFRNTMYTHTGATEQKNNTSKNHDLTN